MHKDRWGYNVYEHGEYPCDNDDCKEVKVGEQKVYFIPGDEHYFCSEECAVAFVKKYLDMRLAVSLKNQGRDDMLQLPVKDALRLAQNDQLNREMTRRGYVVCDHKGNDVSLHGEVDSEGKVLNGFLRDSKSRSD